MLVIAKSLQLKRDYNTSFQEFAPLAQTTDTYCQIRIGYQVFMTNILKINALTVPNQPSNQPFF